MKYKIEHISQSNINDLDNILNSNAAWGYELVEIIPIIALGFSDGYKIIFKLKDLKL